MKYTIQEMKKINTMEQELLLKKVLMLSLISSQTGYVRSLQKLEQRKTRKR